MTGAVFAGLASSKVGVRIWIYRLNLSLGLR